MVWRDAKRGLEILVYARKCGFVMLIWKGSRAILEWLGYWSAARPAASSEQGLPACVMRAGALPKAYDPCSECIHFAALRLRQQLCAFATAILYAPGALAGRRAVADQAERTACGRTRPRCRGAEARRRGDLFGQ